MPALPYNLSASLCFFFFQAEDGIRDLTVTGVQTCALPISLAVFGLDHDLPRRGAPRDPDLLGLGRETDVLRGGLDPAADGAVVEGGGELGLGLHLVQQSIVPEEQLTDVDAVVQGPHQEEQRNEAASGGGAAPAAGGALHHCDWAPSTRSLTSRSSATLRPSTSRGGA